MKERFSILFLILFLFVCYVIDGKDIHKTEIDTVKAGFMNPPADCWPHTRWWWPGNPVSKEEITRELTEMRSHGIRGVEQISMDPVYEKGNIPYLSDQFLEMLKYTVSEAKRLGMEVSLNFGGPGWIIGGEWVSEDDKSKDMVPSFVDIEGGQVFKGNLPERLIRTERSWEHFTPLLDGSETLLAVIAGKISNDGKLIENSLTDLTGTAQGKSIEWKVPEGEWRLMAFWLKKNGIGNALDHFSKRSVERYCDYLGSRLFDALGEEFGKTVESLFVDSFELPNLSSGINWSDGLLDEFRTKKGFDLKLYLPAIWWEVGDISPKIRYDVNEFLHTTGLHTFFSTFLGWCEKHNVKGRIQPYGFNTDNIEAAGMTHIPEMEITAGEKDAADWFDTRIGPKKYVASGAHLYGRKIISAEAYTFIHWERYRETLEELKIASDSYLLSGATKFYNHGFSYSPEQTVSPTRSLPFAAFIQPQNVWWKYYPELASYIARCSFLLRQGDCAPDIALYSPLANQWAMNVLNPRKWTREFNWGELGNLLISNGYDYDLINDDALQNMAEIKGGMLKIGNLEYKILILPAIETIPVKTMEFIRKYIENGGVVIALERLPVRSTGYVDFRNNDAEVIRITDNLFNKQKLQAVDTVDSAAPEWDIPAEVQMNRYEHGRTYLIKKVIDRQIWWDKKSSTLDPFLNTIRNHIAPDFGIDFAYEGLRYNAGLTFTHRKFPDRDIYFVCNIQDKRSTIPVTFRVKNSMIRKWDPYTGKISTVLNFSETKNGIKVPLDLAPYESMFLEFSQGVPATYITRTDFPEIEAASNNRIKAFASMNGSYQTSVVQGGSEKISVNEVSGIPAPFIVTGRWNIKFTGNGSSDIARQSEFLYSWTDDSLTRNFSGTATYKIIFKLLPEYCEKDFDLFLDLGKVGNVAEVILNGKYAGTVWMCDQKLNITKLAKQGSNKLTVLVTNTLINRVSGMSRPPAIPADLVPVYGSQDALKEIPREFGFKPLPPSGLLGPVRIIPLKYVYLK